MSDSPAAIIVGEVLWDCFSEQDGGRQILGGAPLNVAWNLAGFGLDPLFISAVGDDDLGHEILSRMKSFGMATQGVAVLPGVATGTVQVTLENGEPKYDIVRGVAWDQIPMPTHELSEMISDRMAAAHRAHLPALFYHGSLAFRDPRSRTTLMKLRDLILHDPIRANAFFDVNLRAPHYEQDILKELRKSASFIKLNLDELNELNGGGSDDPVERTMVAGREFEKDPSQVPLSGLLVTLGAEGALCYTPGCSEPLRVKSPEPEKMEDPVGAGDAFAAVVLHGILTDRPFTNSLHDAVAFASKVCSLKGATCDDPHFYRFSSS
ncbi:carbohydrate kinase family protein [Aporhodopirellula aestuarii]|uniref:Carbohydrate kinase n=1 Tax=Aporhodopirellula aestuarii TaxID=2950107 RepID=A0ABT0U6F9_9BACT|nr:carbohydrate kinase [Aporhodopirellula aestuarii]MCM2372483.1 carbohydrate kinase [Aporhodopirellula aestuarii]